MSEESPPPHAPSGTHADDPIPRPSARVLLLDPEMRVLLFPALPHPDRDFLVWITPGGGLEEGETWEQAAARELREETGLKDARIGPWVWQRRHTWRWRGRWYDARERFCVVRVQQTFMPPDAVLEDAAREGMGLPRWWTIGQLAQATDQRFAPRRMASLLDRLRQGEWPESLIDTGL